MAIFSTHLLNSVNGTHAANVRITFYKIHEDKRTIFLEGETDNSGRMQNEFELTKCIVQEIRSVEGIFETRTLIGAEI